MHHEVTYLLQVLYQKAILVHFHVYYTALRVGESEKGNPHAVEESEKGNQVDLSTLNI